MPVALITAADGVYHPTSAALVIGRQRQQGRHSIYPDCEYPFVSFCDVSVVWALEFMQMWTYGSVHLLLSMIIYKTVVVDCENGLLVPNSNSVLRALKHAENICERTSSRCC